MKNWELWIQRNKPALAHPTNLKEQFVRRVLSTIDEISPEHLAPAHPFTDDKGSERHIDILITIPDRQQIAIEIDGLAPYKTADGDINYRQFNDYLEQQNALNAAYPALLRYGAGKIEHAPDIIASEIRATLRAKAEGSYLPKNKKEDNAAIVEAYQDDILRLKKKWRQEASHLKEKADYLVMQSSNADAGQIRQLEAAIHAHEEKIRQYQRASIAAILTNEIDLKTLIADIQSLKDTMDDIREQGSEGQRGSNKKHLLLVVAAIIAIALIASLAVGLSRRSAKPATHVLDENSGILQKMPAELLPENTLPPPDTGNAADTADNPPPASADTTDAALLPDNDTPPDDHSDTLPAPALDNPPHTAAQTTGHDDSISARDAHQHIGETRRVCGKIVESRNQKRHLYLHMDAATPKQSLSIAINKNNKTLVQQADHLDLAKADICVTGKIEMNKKTPQITVSESSQISFND